MSDEDKKELPDEEKVEDQEDDPKPKGEDLGDENDDKNVEDDAEGDAKEDPPGEDDPKDDDLPTWAREKLTKANTEAANYRKKLRDAEDKLKGAKTPEEVDEIIQQMQKDREDGEVALLRENVALSFGISKKAWKFLTGTTREELEANAKELAEFAGGEEDEDVNLEGGLNPRSRGNGGSEDPRTLAKKHGHRRSH